MLCIVKRSGSADKNEGDRQESVKGDAPGGCDFIDLSIERLTQLHPHVCFMGVIQPVKTWSDQLAMKSLHRY
jgi:hypothetical protein